MAFLAGQDQTPGVSFGYLIEDDLSVIRWYLDDSGDYDEITRADAQEAYKGLESHLKDLDAALRDFVSEYKDYTW